MGNIVITKPKKQLASINCDEKTLKELALYREAYEILKAYYQQQIPLNERLRLIEIEEELGI